MTGAHRHRKRKAKRNGMARSTVAVLDFVRRLGAKPVQAMLNVYKDKIIAIANYGSEIWGYKNCAELQIVENEFLRSLLSVPQSMPSYIIHQEVGICFMVDLIRKSPFLKWISI